MKFLSIIFLVSISACFGQSGNIEHSKSVQADLDIAKQASDLAWNLKDRNPDSSLYYAKLALEHSRKCSDKKIEAFSLADIGNYYKRKEQYQRALGYYKKSLTARYQLKDNDLIAGGYNQIGLLYRQQEKYDSSIIFFRSGLSAISTYKNSKQRLKLLNGYSMSLYHTGEHKKALSYIDSAFYLAEKLNDSLSLAKLLQNKGTIHQYLDQNRLSIRSYNRAKAYYESLDDVSGMIDIQINLASIYLAEGKVEKAERLLLDSEKRSLEKGLDYNIPIIHFDLAKLYSEREISKAEYYFRQVYDNSKQIGNITLQLECGIELCQIGLIQEKKQKVFKLLIDLESCVKGINDVGLKIDFYGIKSRYFRKVGNFKEAFKNNEMLLILKDSLYNRLNDVKDLSALLEVSRQEKKATDEGLKRKDAEKQRAILQNKFDRIAIWSLVLIVFVLLIIIWLVRKSAKNKTRFNIIQLEKFQQEQDFQNQINKLTFEADLKFLQESLIFEEKIRKDIGKDLHDHLASKLAVIQISLDSIADSETPESAKHIELNRVINLVEETCDDVRIIAHNLIEQERLKETLNESFINHCRNINKSDNLTINYQVIGEAFNISMVIKKNLLATVILLIDNVIRHADASQASLQLFYHDDSLNVILHDNGIGFSSEVKTLGKGVGLKNAQERIQDINGELDINTQLNQGTTISISIPIRYEH